MTNEEYSKLDKDQDRCLYEMDKLRTEWRKGRDRINKSLEKGFEDINNKLKQLLAP